MTRDDDIDTTELDKAGSYISNRVREEIAYKMRLARPAAPGPVRKRPAVRIAQGAGFLLATAAAAGAVYAAVNLYEPKQDFRIDGSNWPLHPGQRFEFDVYQNGGVVALASLAVGAPQSNTAGTFYRVQQTAPGADDTYYWLLDGTRFCQFIDPSDRYPQLTIKLPLKAGMRWDALSFPDKTRRSANTPVKVRYVAKVQQVIETRAGAFECIEVVATEAGREGSLSIWMTPVAPVARILLNPSDPGFYAELNSANPPLGAVSPMQPGI